MKFLACFFGAWRFNWVDFLSIWAFVDLMTARHFWSAAVVAALGMFLSITLHEKSKDYDA